MNFPPLRSSLLSYAGCLIIGFAVVVTSATATPVAQSSDAAEPATEAEEKPKSRQRKRQAAYKERLERDYVETGETRSCLRLRSFRQTRVIDDRTIFFDAFGPYGYLNTLNTSCPNLAFEERFAYNVTGGNSVCQGEIITVLDSFGRQWGSCALGPFLQLKKRDKDPTSTHEEPRSEK